MIRLVRFVHGRFIFRRRVLVLAKRIARCLPEGAQVLDIGCGSGDVAAGIMALRSDIAIEGVDVLVRPDTRIPVKEFDGLVLTHADKSFDAVLLVDVLHHAADPLLLLREATRVARRVIIVKDHQSENRLHHLALALCDWVGNRPYGVRLKYDFWTEARWRITFEDLGVDTVTWNTGLGIYTWPLSLVFDGHIQMLCCLDVDRNRLASGAYQLCR